MVVVVVDLAGWQRFFVGATVGLGIGGVVGLAIDGAVLIRTDVAIGFFVLSLW